MRHLYQLGRHVAERIHNTIAVEITRLDRLVEVHAVGKIALAPSSLRIKSVRLLPDGLIGPIPDASAG